MKKKRINNIHDLRLEIAELKYRSLEKEQKIKYSFSDLGAMLRPGKLAQNAVNSISGSTGFAKTPYSRLLQIGIAYSVEKIFFRKKSKTFQSTIILVIQSFITFLLQYSGDDIVQKFRDAFESFKAEGKKEKKKTSFEDENDYLGIWETLFE